MSLTHLPRHQHIYDLLGATPGMDPGRTDTFSGMAPPALVDFWTIRAAIDVGEERPAWVLGTDRLFTEYSGGFWCPSATELSNHLQHASSGGAPGRQAEWGSPPTEHPLVPIESDEVRIWHAFAELDGSNDPPVLTHCGDSSNARAGWTREERRFTDFMFSFIADWYGESWTPLRYFGPTATETWWDDDRDYAHDEMQEKLKPAGPEWLRGRVPRVEDTAVAALAQELGAPAKRALGACAQHLFRLERGRVILTSDDSETAIWVDAWSGELGALLERVLGCVDARELLVADHDASRDVLARLLAVGSRA